MGTHPIFESDFDCLTDFRFGFRVSKWPNVQERSVLPVNTVPVTVLLSEKSLKRKLLNTRNTFLHFAVPPPSSVKPLVFGNAPRLDARLLVELGSHILKTTLLSTWVLRDSEKAKPFNFLCQ